MDQLVQTTRKGATAIVRMNRPERRNALSAAMSGALFEALSVLDRDPDCCAIVLTGAEGNFCAGGDLSETAVDSIAAGRIRMSLTPRVVRLLAGGAKPVVAAVEGHAIGAGMALAAACDYVVVAANARFSAAFVRVGLGVDGGLSWTLPRRVGLGQAKRLLLTGATVDGETAARIGLAEEVVPAGQALEAALAVAESYHATAPAAVALTKQLLAQGFSSLDQCLAMEGDFQSALFLTTDAAEGRAAMREKRAPRFIGK
jgi:2-(1,2-epoxy-1,2-dihydrophenyl)acetyl-CoA isomerase